MSLKNISKGLVKIFGSRNERMVKIYMQTALKSIDFEQGASELSESDLKNRAGYFKEKIETGASPESIIPEVFATVREAAKRNVEMRHFDVQLVGGNVLYDGKIAEMATGEGKTLVATLAAYMVHLTGRKVHVVTVNDYLAKRDADWMRPVYDSLGLTVGAIQADMDSSGSDRKQQYGCDVTYGTNNEFGFDYLRDNMKMSLEDMAQGPLEYAIVDEVDSILIDEARTPLIISGPAFDDVTRYKKADHVSRQLINFQSEYTQIQNRIDTAKKAVANAQGELSESKKDKDPKRIEAARKVIDTDQKIADDQEQRLLSAIQYFEVEYDRKSVHLTHEGIGKAQELAEVGSFFTGSNMDWPHLLEQSLRAHVIYEREKEYVVMDGKIVIVDDFTGRLMHGRQWSDGLHQAIEAKENVTVKEESQTIATITLQNFFKLYDRLAGMTGTAETEAGEFMSIYKLDVVVIPTDKPCIRDDREDAIYKSMAEKFNAIVEEINDVSSAGRPVLVGTISIEKSETISNALKRKYGIEHEVLNAKQHTREASIVEKAGDQHTDRKGQLRGNVTIATNMAGRGTDIKLGSSVAQKGGLHILGTERHEARRIDNQLRGRAGRQGDKGSSQFFLSFDDDLMSVFAPEWTVKALAWIGWQEGEPIYHKRISKGIEKAQKKVEERNFDIRKNLLEYDEVMDYQRKIFYTRRRDILSGKALKEIISSIIESITGKLCNSMLDKNYSNRCIVDYAEKEFGVELRPSDVDGLEPIEAEEVIKKRAKESISNEISVSLGEYLEDYEDRRTWDINGLSKWAMSAFKVSLSLGKIKNSSPEEIQDQLTESALLQVDKRQCSVISEFTEEDYALKMLIEAAESKFEVKIDIEDIRELDPEKLCEYLIDKTEEKYEQRQIEYPVEFAMNMVFGPQGQNVYAYQSLSDWVKRKYRQDLSAEQLQETKPHRLHEKLLKISRDFIENGLDREIADNIGRLSDTQTIEWVKERFETDIDIEQLGSCEDKNQYVKSAAMQFVRSELNDLEKYVLLQIYDSTWKDHLYAMDHLKEGIWTRSLAEKDPKIEYKRESYRMFNEMLDTIEDRVSDVIFKVHLEAGARTRSIWNVSKTAHNEVGQFAMAERQRAAAQAPQGEVKVKQIKLDQPKVGRNEPCPCGSGKKFKKCCGI